MANKFNEARQIDDCYSVVGGTPKRTKKLTGTRLGKALGLNHWGTPFQAWCEVMKVAEPPFEGNKYTEAGEAIEPKLVEYCRENVAPYVEDPCQFYHTDTPKQDNWYDFFDSPIFGGMWDALVLDGPDSSTANIIGVIECKTSSRPQDWEHGVPEHYAVQGLMYAQLLGVKDCWFPVAFLEPDDYEHPENFECTDENTMLFHMNVDDPIGIYVNIVDCLESAEKWWEYFVVENLSPAFDEKKDKDYLGLIRQCDVEDLDIDANDLTAVCDAMYNIETQLQERFAKEIDGKSIDQLKKEYAEWKKQALALVKPTLLATEGKDSLQTDHYLFTMSVGKKCDYDKLEQDGLLEKYVGESYSFKVKEN